VSTASFDPFRQHDAAYVLGSLSPEDRAAFEDHLTECTDCALSVQELAGMPGLLAHVDIDAFSEPATPQLPDTLLPRLLAEVRRTRRRRTSIGVAVAAAAAAVVAGVTVAVPQIMDRPSQPGQAMTQVAATPLRARLTMDSVDWGTKLTLTCTYDAPVYPGEVPSYSLLVHTKGGRVEHVATWRAVPGKTTVLNAATAASPADITSVEVRTTSGQPVLRLAG
jgi:hypothetical protein